MKSQDLSSSAAPPRARGDGWTRVCRVDEIVPDTGVCACVGGAQVAVFRVAGDAVHAIGNVDPNAQAAVLSRGLTGSLSDRLVVASPLYKHHFDLHTGECLEVPGQHVPVYAARVDAGVVWVRPRGEPAEAGA